MGSNVHQGQLRGPFAAEQELFTLIKKAAAVPFTYITHIGVQTDVRNIIIVNGKEYEIGKTGIYEIGNTEITSLKFKEDVDINTIVDYTIEEDNI